MNTLPGSNFQYWVTIHINLIQMTPNSIGQTKHRIYLAQILSQSPIFRSFLTTVKMQKSFHVSVA
jgi:hypothetical protein